MSRPARSCSLMHAVVASHQACQFSSSFHHSRMSAPARLYLVYHRGLGYEPIIVVGRIVSVTFVGTALSSRWAAPRAPGPSVQHRDGPDRRAVAPADPQREPEEPEPPADDRLEIREVLVVGDAVLPAEQVDRVDLVRRVVGPRRVDAEALALVVAQPVRRRLVEARVLRRVLARAA